MSVGSTPGSDDIVLEIAKVLVVDAVTGPLVSVVDDEAMVVSEEAVKLMMEGVEKRVLANETWVDEEVIVEESPGLGENSPATVGSPERNPAARSPTGHPALHGFVCSSPRKVEHC